MKRAGTLGQPPTSATTISCATIAVSRPTALAHVHLTSTKSACAAAELDGS